MTGWNITFSALPNHMGKGWQNSTQFFNRLLGAIFTPERKTCVDDDDAPDDQCQYGFTLQQSSQPYNQQDQRRGTYKLPEQLFPHGFFLLLGEDVLPIERE